MGRHQRRFRACGGRTWARAGDGVVSAYNNEQALRRAIREERSTVQHSVATATAVATLLVATLAAVASATVATLLEALLATIAT